MTPLFIDWNVDPVLFSIFGLEIRYYSLTWVAAILIGAKLFDYFCQREGLRKEISESIFLYATLGTILGARIGHCLFYEPEQYLLRPWAMITEIRDGGLASHGATIGIIFSLWLFSRRNKLPFMWSLDRIVVAGGIGGALIRIGNLFNSEIFGTQTTLTWGFRFLRSREWQSLYAPEACHPTQIYEAICYLITFVVLGVMYHNYDLARRRPGVMFGSGLVMIFLSRILIESIKNIQVGFEESMLFNMGQLLSLPFVIFGLYLIVRGYTRPAIEINSSNKLKK